MPALALVERLCLAASLTSAKLSSRPKGSRGSDTGSAHEKGSCLWAKPKADNRGPQKRLPVIVPKAQAIDPMSTSSSDDAACEKVWRESADEALPKIRQGPSLVVFPVTAARL